MSTGAARATGADLKYTQDESSLSFTSLDHVLRHHAVCTTAHRQQVSRNGIQHVAVRTSHSAGCWGGLCCLWPADVTACPEPKAGSKDGLF